MVQENNEIDFSLKKFLNQNATHGEKNFAIVRICLTIMLFSQMVVFTGSLKELAEGSLKYWLITLGVLVAIIFSIAVLILLKPHHESTALRLWSIAIDAVVMFLILFPSTLWPSVRYNGFLSRMDAAILIFVIIGTCFRLKKRGILIGGVLTIMVTLPIFYVDFVFNKEIILYSIRDVAVYALLILGSIILSFAILKRIIWLVTEGSQAMIKAERARLRLGVYISQELVDDALSAEVLKPGGNRQNVAILFSDLRGFTTYSESISPDRLVAELNEYLEAMVRVIKEEGGVVDKYIGDAIMVVFGIPYSREDDALRAVRCAWRMDHALKEHNIERRSKGLPELRQGIGVHYGEVIAGNLGTSERLQYTVIGDSVNLASRLESATKDLGNPVIISQETIKALPEENSMFNFRSCGIINVKGREGAIEVYTFEAGINDQDSTSIV